MNTLRIEPYLTNSRQRSILDIIVKSTNYMKNLIIPMAGKSSRFPNMKPKWMLTHPMKNRFMGIESILGLNLRIF
jgi:hypothetical protein